MNRVLELRNQKIQVLKDYNKFMEFYINQKKHEEDPNWMVNNPFCLDSYIYKRAATEKKQLAIKLEIKILEEELQHEQF